MTSTTGQVYANSVLSSFPPFSNSIRQICVNVPLQSEQLDQNSVKYLPLTSYLSNRIRTSKYTLFSFVPKNLFEQFRRVANFFFLLLIILQAFNEFAVINVGLAAIPIIFIVSVTAIKDGFEDYKRMKNDKIVNNRLSQTLDPWINFNFPNHKPRDSLDVEKGHIAPQWTKTAWKNIRVGDFIYLENDEPIPADIILLSTSEIDCICYVETKNLDGESNLKLRQGPSETSWIKKPEDCLNPKMIIECEAPTTNMLRYQGTIYYYPNKAADDVHRSCSTNKTSVSQNSSHVRECSYRDIDINQAKKILVDINGIVLRGAVIRNTKWVVGIVVYTGDDTKQLMNSGKTPSKRSQLEKLMNLHVTFNLFFMITICLACAIGYPFWLHKYVSLGSPFILGLVSGSLVWDGFLNFWSSLILFQTIVPISLYISIEIVKTAQAFFIHEDLEMYDEKSDTACMPRSWNLADNLGQIEYIFSDKTGTLTRNIMEFKKCSIDGIMYDGSSNHLSTTKLEMEKKYALNEAVKPEILDQSLGATGETPPLSPISFRASWIEGVHSLDLQSSSLLGLTNNIDPKQSSNQTGWHDQVINQYFQDPKLFKTKHAQRLRLFFTLLSVCHTVLIDETESKNFTISYKAQSPDEACLVTLAAETGFVFKKRNQNRETHVNEIEVEILGKAIRFDLLNIVEFDSDRKRMSVICRIYKDVQRTKSEIVLFCKGADSVVFERLAQGQQFIKEKTNSQLEMFAQEGLRTLCLAYRIIPYGTYTNWALRYHQTSSTIFPDPMLRAKALEVLNDEVENQLTLLGATAIEDKLQQGVPECIQALSNAGIKIWVLTGDKIETAINIGFLCGLLKSTTLWNGTEDHKGGEEMILIQVKEAMNVVEVDNQMTLALDNFWGVRAISAATENEHKFGEYALIIDGQSLKFALENEKSKQLFLNLGCRCRAVICCRVSPLQKAKVVELVKHGKSVMTLAIGDGANDVSMIQAADVGVGISGEEGLQASTTSDYAISQFRFLSRLLLIHGRWSYSRVSSMILNFYLKSLVFSLLTFWYQIYSGWSASYNIEYGVGILYNLIFTSLPTTVAAIFDQDGDDDIIMEFPEIYKTEGIPQPNYTNKLFIRYVVEAIWHSICCFFIPMLSFSDDITNGNGNTTDRIFIGFAMAVPSILCVNISVAVDMHKFNWITLSAILFSCFSIYLYTIIVSAIRNTGLLDFDQELLENTKFWLTELLALVFAFGPRILYYYIRRTFYPLDSEIVQEIRSLLKSGQKDIAYLKNLQPHQESPKVQNYTLNSSMNRKFSSANSPEDFEKLSFPKGFSFQHTKGMGSIVMGDPLYLSASSKRKNNLNDGLRPSSRGERNRKQIPTISINENESNKSQPKKAPSDEQVPSDSTAEKSLEKNSTKEVLKEKKID